MGKVQARVQGMICRGWHTRQPMPMQDSGPARRDPRHQHPDSRVIRFGWRWAPDRTMHQDSDHRHIEQATSAPA